MAQQLTDELKYELMGKIHAGVPLRELVEETGVAYPKLLAIRSELKQAKLEGKIHELINVDEVIVAKVATEVQQDLAEMSPLEGELLLDETSKVVAGAKGLQLLDKRLQVTALNITSKLNELATNAEGPKELANLADTICKIQTAFFNRGTQVNIQNNVSGESTAFKKFLKD